MTSPPLGPWEPWWWLLYELSGLWKQMALIGLTRLNSETNELPLGQRINRYVGQSQINGIVICTLVTLLLIFGVQTPDHTVLRHSQLFENTVQAGAPSGGEERGCVRLPVGEDTFLHTAQWCDADRCIPSFLRIILVLQIVETLKTAIGPQILNWAPQ